MEILILIIAFALTITIHEASHAWMSDRLGDPTARLDGRLSLNPLVHYDPVGTTLLIVTVIMTIAGILPFPFGWAKPVVVDPYNLKDPKKDSALIAFAGPLSNLILAALLAIIIRITGSSTLFSLFSIVILLNVALAIFNLVPIYPLDGGNILMGLLPNKEARELEIFLQRYGLILLLFIIFPIFNGVSILSIVIDPIIRAIINLLLPGLSTI